MAHVMTLPDVYNDEESSLQIARKLQFLKSELEKIALSLDIQCSLIAQDDQLNASAFRFESSKSPSPVRNGFDETSRLTRSTRPPLPDPRRIRSIIRRRQLRTRFFDGELFADPAWDMLLDLAAARVEHVRVSITSLCIASGVPPTTALRWISQMTDAGLFERREDDTDRRRAFISLSDKAADALARYFHEFGPTNDVS